MAIWFWRKDRLYFGNSDDS